MAIRVCKPYTPGTRNAIYSTFSEVTKTKPEKKLIKKYHSSQGRNNKGRITIRHRGGQHKRRYRIVDFRRNKLNVVGSVHAIEYDPNRNAYIALIHYEDGEKRYILYPDGLKIGSKIIAGITAPIAIGNSLPLANIPLGSFIHNVELFPNQGGQIVRSAGTAARLLARDGNYVTVKLPSKEIRLIHSSCYATIGIIGNRDFNNLVLGKAGRKRWLGIRPTVRGTVMNPCDHPHGGGEGRSPIGRKKPYTPWGKPALGVKTRKRNKYSNMFILRGRS